MPILPESSAARVSLFFNFINFFLSFLFEKDFKNYFFFLLYFLFSVVTALSIKIRRTSKRYEAEGEKLLRLYQVEIVFFIFFKFFYFGFLPT